MASDQASRENPESSAAKTGARREQEFNSLDAQREACEAYITSQRHEGWTVLSTLYDDGAYSGGTMDRPALQRLLDDIRGSKVDVVVVYKVDRLTRSLADFAKIVEIFDAQRVSFVSVTQAFNTTTSMGRLTLNVLLSFAQFEAPRPFRRRGDAPGRRAVRGPLRHRGYVMPIVSHAAAPPRYGGVLPPIFGFFMTTNSARARCSSADRPGAGSPRIATGSAMTRAAFARAITRRVRRSVGLAGGLSVGCLTLRPSAWRRGNAPHPRSTGARQRCTLMC